MNIYGISNKIHVPLILEAPNYEPKKPTSQTRFTLKMVSHVNPLPQF